MPNHINEIALIDALVHFAHGGNRDYKNIHNGRKYERFGRRIPIRFVPYALIWALEVSSKPLIPKMKLL
ncbi:MAG: hypothetical protein OXI36_05885 [Gammaproteobacteria bacterium]|nr:hypothetical protein [Gammaproteobacteria bacterium]MDE0402943.1 hypothetical protein [Gammaproteobacteria bacterium]